MWVLFGADPQTPQSNIPFKCGYARDLSGDLRDPFSTVVAPRRSMANM